jgi:hypothetical protein
VIDLLPVWNFCGGTGPSRAIHSQDDPPPHPLWRETSSRLIKRGRFSPSEAEPKYPTRGGKMAVSFATDIKPLFRAIDVEHMNNFGVSLDDYSYMSDPTDNHANAQHVEDRLKNQSMPPGGPFWTPAQLALFNLWRTDGYAP